MNPTLFDEPAGAVRASDPQTSRDAAASITGRTERLVMQTFAMFPDGLTDDELCARLSSIYGPTVKSARSRCSRRGWLVDSGETRPSARGVQMVVWKPGPRPEALVVEMETL